jgi:hypothetical protein
MVSIASEGPPSLTICSYGLLGCGSTLVGRHGNDLMIRRSLSFPTLVRLRFMAWATFGLMFMSSLFRGVAKRVGGMCECTVVESPRTAECFCVVYRQRGRGE